jgi:hypothetical protein
VTKTTKAILAGAAFAGLFAGTGAAVKASTTSFPEGFFQRLGSGSEPGPEVGEGQGQEGQARL